MRFFLILILALGSFSFHAGARIVGKVVDESGNKIVDADVYLQNTVYKTTTNVNGRFNLSDIGTHKIYQMVTVKAGYDTVFTICLIDSMIAYKYHIILE